MRRLAVVLALVMLGAFPARAGSVDVDFNPKAEFERYKTWGWAPDSEEKRRGVLADATMRERVEKHIAGCLLERGLTPAGTGETPDVLVRYMGDTGTGKTANTTNAFYSDPWTPAYRTVQVQEQAATMVVDLIDASANALAWRLYVNQTMRNPNDSPDKFWRALEKGLAKYPPSESERAKKAREVEKRSQAK
jgi:hypothetical protein